MDITLCHGYNCPLKEHCYRFVGNVPADKLSIHQSYFMEAPFSAFSCEYFIEIEDYDKKKD